MCTSHILINRKKTTSDFIFIAFKKNIRQNMYIIVFKFDHVIYLIKYTLPAHFRALPRHHLYTGSNGLNKV